jgi:hypothetical protein
MVLVVVPGEPARACARACCDVVLVVVTPNRRVAAWAARALLLGHPGVSLVPLVLGPEAVPRVRSVAEARRSPDLAVLSALMHGKSASAESIGRAALAAFRDLDDERATLYTDLVLLSMRAAAREVLVKLMANGTYEYGSDFAKRYVAQGRVEGRTEGLAAGRNEGLAAGRALSVLAFLEARGLEIPAAVRERVLACTDISILDRWISRAVTAKTALEVVEAPTTRKPAERGRRRAAK